MDALDGEVMADYSDRQTMLSAVVVSGSQLDGNARRKVLGDLSLSVEHAELLRAADFDGAAEHRFANSSLAAEVVHGMLHEAGLVSQDPVEEEEP